MCEKYIKISRLKVGDIFCYRNVIYEVVMKNTWSTTCKYINDTITPIFLNIFIVILIIIQK